MSSPRLSIVIPAHNEAVVIGRALGSILRDAQPDEFDVVVVANGCDDDTASIVRRSFPAVRVVEIEVPSKIAALNAGDAATTVFPRAYVDADIEVSTEALRAVAEVLAEGEALVAAPRMRVDARGASWAVRAHHRIWELSEYRRSGHIGSGIYALSAAGRSRFDRFPEVIADDRYVQQLFTADERCTILDHEFVVRSPRTVRDLVHRSVRAAAGNQQLGTQGRSQPAGSRFASLLKRVAARPTLWPAFAVYAVVYVAPRVLARRKLASGEAQIWERDESSRV